MGYSFLFKFISAKTSAGLSIFAIHSLFFRKACSGWEGSRPLEKCSRKSTKSVHCQSHSQVDFYINTFLSILFVHVNHILCAFFSYYKIYRDFLFYIFIFICETPIWSGLLLFSLPLVEVLKFFSKGGILSTYWISSLCALMVDKALSAFLFLKTSSKAANGQIVRFFTLHLVLRENTKTISKGREFIITTESIKQFWITVSAHTDLNCILV